jgi:predicted amidohydrolase
MSSQRTREAKPQNQLHGCSTVPALFAFAFQRATTRLLSADVAALIKSDVGDVAALRWMEHSAHSALVAHIDVLASRGDRFRWRLREPERSELLAILGGVDALDDGRVMFLLAQALDDRYADARPVPNLDPHVIQAPERFLSEIANGPPPIGQMTPAAACRRWMRTFWYTGIVRGFDAFGRVPQHVPIQLGARATQSLQRAIDEESLRLCVITWRRHAVSDLRQLPAAAGCFAVGGMNLPPEAARLTRLIDHVASARAHIVLFPELMLDDTEFALVRSELAKRARRWPALVVVGRVHRPSPTGAYSNQAVVVDAAGSEVASHEKLEPFTASGGVLEDVIPRDSAEYQFVDTPVGRMVVNICRDFRSDVPMLLNRILGASLLVVPAYSKRLDFVVEEARILGARQQAIVASVVPLCSDLEDLCVAYAPIRGASSVSRTTQDLVSGAAIVSAQMFTIAIGPHRVATLSASPHALV